MPWCSGFCGYPSPGKRVNASVSAGQHLAYAESPTSEDDIVVPGVEVDSEVEISGESKSHQGALSDGKLVKERQSGHGVIPLVGTSS